MVRTITFEQLCKWKISNYICRGSGILHHAIDTLLPMCSTFHAGHDPNARYGQQYPNIVQVRNLKLCIRSGHSASYCQNVAHHVYNVVCQSRSPWLRSVQISEMQGHVVTTTVVAVTPTRHAEHKVCLHELIKQLATQSAAIETKALLNVVQKVKMHRISRPSQPFQYAYHQTMKSCSRFKNLISMCQCKQVERQPKIQSTLVLVFV